MSQTRPLAEIIEFLQELAPIALAEDWDNVGLLVGDKKIAVSSVLTCLTLTPDVAAEAIEDGVQLVVSHHPVLFRPVQKITAETYEGRMLLDLIAAGVAVYSPHTGYDSSHEGINQQLAELFELTEVGVLRPLESGLSRNCELSEDSRRRDEKSEVVGAGRYGTLPVPLTLAQLSQLVKERLDIPHLQYVGEESATIRRVGIACGAAAEFLQDAIRHGCEAFLTGEARFHACLEARALGIPLILPGHYATERPAMERLARSLAEAFPGLSVRPSQTECDPIQWS